MVDIRKLADSLHPLERKILPLMKDGSDFPTLVSRSRLQDIEVLRALQWMANKKIAILHESSSTVVHLEENGKEYLGRGLPEKRFLDAISGEASPAEIKKLAELSDEEFSACLGLLRKKGAIAISKKGEELAVMLTDGGTALKRDGMPEQDFLEKKFPLMVDALSQKEKAILKGLRQRKKIVVVGEEKAISAELTATGRLLLGQKLEEESIDRITPDILASGSWKNATLRRYDVTTPVPYAPGGRRHFVEQAMRYIKDIWLEMGFREMEGNMVQTAFWDLDALFVPQDHPAREMQDTFYLKDPKNGHLPEDVVRSIRDMHERGGSSGSRGWGGTWSEEIAKRNLLRTHTTVLSAKTLAALRKEDLPAKYFSVGKVFRNEALSWKHLFEFIQVEGIVVDPNANFKNLKGYLREFFTKMGFADVRIRPAHFPYTEPSAEVDVFHPGKKIWVELGGAGIFRPEVVIPLLGEDVPVLAWGLGMERSMMEYYSFTDIRDIYKNDVKQLREIPLWVK